MKVQAYGVTALLHLLYNLLEVFPLLFSFSEYEKNGVVLEDEKTLDGAIMSIVFDDAMEMVGLIPNKEIIA